jgi:hypothetical protein
VLVDLEPPWTDEQYGSLCYGPRGAHPVSLGRHLIKWGATWLTLPDGRHAGDPWLPTREQARFVINYFALEPGWTPYTPCDADCDPTCDPEYDHARWVYHRGVLRRMKGAGKDPLAAYLCFCHLLGPVVPTWDDHYGRWVGTRHGSPLVQIAAVAQFQTRNTGLLFNGMLPERTRAEYAIDVQSTVVTIPQGRLESLTASPLAAEGPRVTFAVINEPQNWIEQLHLAMAAVMRRNSAKVGGRTLEIGNAHQPGQESVSEQTERAYNDWRAGKLITNPRILFDNRTAQPNCRLDDLDLLRAGLVQARGDSIWVKVTDVRTAMAATDATPTQSRRYYFNLTDSAEDAWTTEPAWMTCARPGRMIPRGNAVMIFADLSKSRDATAMTACDLDTGHVQPLGIWQRKHGAHRSDLWTVPRHDVYRVGVEAMMRWRVLALWADPGSGEDDEGVAWWDSTIDDWAEELGDDKEIMPAVTSGPRAHRVRWDMRHPLHTKSFTLAAERTLADITMGELTHDGHPLLQQHVLNCKKRPNQFGISVGKEHRDSANLVDGGVSMVGARMMRLIYKEWITGRRIKRAGTVAGVRVAS